ncbi:type VII secretion protein EssA [Alkalihalophilus lindianensis]|uniref:Type VII secretion protein EssA n=1 Tax=Alkalihalophilus lindianensis TaxID=1630542 RepID=A0ABU3XFC6_9BACI|nr:type VII secretion protein EssA [Alkalihalophilus lindianensis]MDV2686599.1 type VII secretion protein EssA [Alkalihalophilus lindianensis]
MRVMKVNSKITPTLLFCFMAMLLPSVVLAEEAKIAVPQQYQERNIKVDLNYYREDEQRRRQAIPEEQRVLTFNQRELSYFTDVYDQLFLQSTLDTNTIATKAEQLQLFSGGEDSIPVNRSAQAEPTTGFIQVSTLLIISVILVIAILVIVVIPKVIRKPTKYDQL